MNILVTGCNGQLGNELPDFLRAMEERPVRGIRMNPRGITRPLS